MAALLRIASERPVAFDLGAVHQPAALRVELVAAVEDTAIVPEYEVADLPLLVPGKFRAGWMGPECVEQLFAVFEPETLDVGVAPAPEKERLAGGDRMVADDRGVGAGCPPRVGHLGRAAAQLAGAVAARIVPAEPAFDPAS